MAAMPINRLGGRKRRDDLWTYFQYNSSERKTECIVLGDDGKCGHKLGGKNTTNLKRHLKAHHADIFSKIPVTRTPIQKSGCPNNDGAQTSIETAFAAGSKYKSNSVEQHVKEQALALWIGRTGLPACTVEDEDFIHMMETFDKRMTIPKRTKINNLVDKIYDDEKLKYKERLARARKIAIGLDIWTKKGLTASFLHSSLMNQMSPLAPTPRMNPSRQSDPEDSEVAVRERQRFGAIDMSRTPCVVHTLQLVVNMIQKDTSVNRLLSKVRGLVKLFRKSSVATERLLQMCQLTLIKDCPTRWSSTYQMISRLLQIKDSVVQVADGMSWDYLLSSEWHKLSALRDLLIPFAEHTQLLQSDTQSLSLVVPAILDLQGHLSEFPHAQGSSFKDLASLAIKMKANMDKRFSCFLDHTDSKFSPLAAAACFLDPTVAPEALLENDDEQIEALLRRSEDYLAQLVPPVVREEEAEDEEPAEGEESKEEQPHNKRPRFRFLSKPSRPSKSTISKPCVKEEIKKFKEQLSQPTNQETALEFWAAQGDYVYPSLKPIALDLLAMPASQAFAERVFSITGDLSRGRRNRARVILERSAFLKLNRGQ
ncbi:zinc finger BED domain-containing protein 4-like [Chanodichthys erythropterus]|uniref:zinc finger BED domain-containing protein 4-like n=1 Tax=Chanodichthys erythropterus TaxID=933992 RepID=UPI00351DD650